MTEILKRGAKKGGSIGGSRAKRIEAAERRMKSIHGKPIGKLLYASKEISDFVKAKQGGIGPSASDITAILSQHNLGSVSKDRHGYDVSDVGSGTAIGFTVDLWPDRATGQFHRAADTSREAMGHNVDPVVDCEQFWKEWQQYQGYKQDKRNARLKGQQQKASEAAKAKRMEVAGTIDCKVPLKPGKTVRGCQPGYSPTKVNSEY